MKHLILIFFLCSCNRSSQDSNVESDFKAVAISIEYYVVNDCIQSTVRLNALSELHNFLFPDKPSDFKNHELRARILLLIDSTVIGGIDPSDHQSMRDLPWTIEKAAFKYFGKSDISVSEVKHGKNKLKITTKRPWLYNRSLSLLVILKIDC